MQRWCCSPWPYYTCIYTERRIVKSLPDDIIKTLGADRIEKSIP